MDITSGFKVVMGRYGVSSNELAKRLGISNAAISKAIGRNAVKRADTVEKYCNAIGCPVSELYQEAEKAEEIQKEQEK